jgi:hypothetical protein
MRNTRHASCFVSVELNQKIAKKKTRGQRLSLFTQTYDSESVDWLQNSTLFLLDIGVMVSGKNL